MSPTATVGPVAEDLNAEPAIAEPAKIELPRAVRPRAEPPKSPVVQVSPQKPYDKFADPYVLPRPKATAKDKPEPFNWLKRTFFATE